MNGRQCGACAAGVHCFGATRCACCRREPEPAVRSGRGGWISGPCLPVPAFPAAARWPAVARLIRATGDRWFVAYHAPGPYWSAERVTGPEIRYACGHSLEELADAIERAEARP